MQNSELKKIHKDHALKRLRKAKVHVYNPRLKRQSLLPIVIGYFDCEVEGRVRGKVVTQDGDRVWQALSSTEAHLMFDLGMVEDYSTGVQDKFKVLYPDGYQCIYFASHTIKEGMPGVLSKALRLAQQMERKP